MRKFKDKNGQEWTIDLNFGTMLRVKTLSQGRFDLLKPEKPVSNDDFPQPVALQVVLMLDYPSLLEVLFYVVEPEAKTKGIDLGHFLDLMAAQCVVDAKHAFRDEWRDFFQNLQRHDQALALEKIGAWMKEAEEKLKDALNNPKLKELDNKVTTEMDLSLKNSFGKLEDFSALIRASSPGGNLT